LKKSLWKTLLIIFMVLLLGVSFVYFDKLVRRETFGLARMKLKNEAMLAMEQAGDLALSEIGAHPEFILTERDSDGRISYLTSNTALLNDIASLTLMHTQENISSRMSRIEVPLGAILGSSLFSNKGPVVPIDIYMQGFAETDFITEIKSAGINQTWYRIYMNISVDLRMVMGAYSEIQRIENQYLLNESLILGHVPESYFAGIGDK